MDILIQAYQRYIKPGLSNFDWRPNREWVLALTVLAIVVNGALQVFDGTQDVGTAVEAIIIAVFGLFTRGQVTPVKEPRDDEGRPLVPIEAEG